MLLFLTLKGLYANNCAKRRKLDLSEWKNSKEFRIQINNIESNINEQYGREYSNLELLSYLEDTFNVSLFFIIESSVVYKRSIFIALMKNIFSVVLN